MELTPLQIERIKMRASEIDKLYEITEAETILMMQLLFSIRLHGHSRKLTVKLLRTLLALEEMLLEETGE